MKPVGALGWRFGLPAACWLVAAVAGRWLAARLAGPDQARPRVARHEGALTAKPPGDDVPRRVRDRATTFGRLAVGLWGAGAALLLSPWGAALPATRPDRLEVWRDSWHLACVAWYASTGDDRTAQWIREAILRTIPGDRRP